MRFIKIVFGLLASVFALGHASMTLIGLIKGIGAMPLTMHITAAAFGLLIATLCFRVKPTDAADPMQAARGPAQPSPSTGRPLF